MRYVLPIILLMTTACSTLADIVAKPASMPTTTRPATTQPGSQYERLLVLYLANIEEIVKTRQDEREADFKETLLSLHERAAYLEKNGESIIAQLRAGAKKNPGGKLDPPDPAAVTIWPYVLAESSVSARLISKLYDECLLNSMFSAFSSIERQPVLCQEWVNLIEKAIQQNAKDPSLVDRLAILLYTKGVSREQYRDRLRTMAMKKNDLKALCTLLFEENGKTGRINPIVSKDNLDLMRQLIIEDRPPQIRIACAHYATRVYEYHLAEETCWQVFSKEYHEVLHPSGITKEQEEQDSQLYHARDEALVLMFYGIRSERMFKRIYNEYAFGSATGTTQPSAPGALSPAWKRVGSVTSRLEHARIGDLLEQIRHLEKTKLTSTARGATNE